MKGHWCLMSREGQHEIVRDISDSTTPVSPLSVVDVRALALGDFAEHRFVMGSGSCDCPLVSLGPHLFAFLFECDITRRSTDRTGAPGLGAFVEDGITRHGHFTLLPDSPAIYRGNDAAFPLTDQLGYTRVWVCDAGAIEILPPS